MTRMRASTVQEAVRALIQAEETSLGIEVLSLVAYPGGDLVSVVIEPHDGAVLVHDAGEAAMWLSQQGVALSKHVRARLQTYASRFRCKFEGDRVSYSGNIESVALAVAMVSNASRSVADYALEIRRHAETDFRELLSDTLRDIAGRRLRENEEIVGDSGRKYRVPAVILDTAEKTPEFFIAPVAAHSSVPHVFSMLYDIQKSHEAVSNKAVYDETSDLRKEDRSLLRGVGEIISFIEAPFKFRQMMSGLPASG